MKQLWCWATVRQSRSCVYDDAVGQVWWANKQMSFWVTASKLKAAYFIYTPSEYHYDFEPLYMYNA